MKTTKYFLKYLLTIYLATSWIGCQAYPEHDRLIDGKRETPKSNDNIAADPCKKPPPESENNDVKVTTEKPHSNVNYEEGKGDDVTTDQVLERPARNSPHFLHRPPSQSPRIGFKAHNEKAKISEMYERQEHRNFGNELTKFIQNILADVRELMNLAKTIYTGYYEPSLVAESANHCSGCSSLLNNYPKTQSLIEKFLNRESGKVNGFVKEPSHSWHRMNEILRPEDTELNIVACVTRMTRKLFQLLNLIRECAEIRDDVKSQQFVNSIKNFISRFDVGSFEILDKLMEYDLGYSSIGALMRDASSEASSMGSPKRNYQAAWGSENRRSRRFYNVDNEDANVSSTTTLDLEALEHLLEFLRSIPEVLSEIVHLINSGCAERPVSNGSGHRKIASQMYNRGGRRHNSHGTSAAHAASDFIVGTPRNVDSSESTSSTSSFPAHDGRLHHSSFYDNKESETSLTDNDSERSDEPFGYSSSLYDEDSSEILKKNDKPVLDRARNKHTKTAAAMSRPFTTFNEPVNPTSREQEPILGRAHRKFFDWRPRENSLVSTGSSPGFPARNMIISGFPSSSSPQYHFVNTIKYEGPANTHGGPIPYFTLQFPGLPSFYFNPSVMNFNVFSKVDSNDNDGNQIDFSSLFDEDRPFEISREVALQISMDQGDVLVGSDPVKFGDYIALHFGKCTLAARLIEGSETIDFQLLGTPLFSLKTNDRFMGSIWKYSTDHVMDLVDDHELNILKRKCNKISHSSTSRRKTIYRSSAAIRD